MQKCGLIGGIGPESTINYYASITRSFQEHLKTRSGPPLILNSIDLTKMLGFIQAQDHQLLVDYLTTAVEECARGGAKFAALAACTPHVVYEQLQERSSIPILSIVEATRDRAVQLGVRNAGLFGTRFTMEGQFFPTAFQETNIVVVAPTQVEQEYIHRKYFSELVSGVVSDATRSALLDIVENMKDRHAIDALILGGTELSLILSGDFVCGISLLDTTAIHVEAITKCIADG